MSSVDEVRLIVNVNQTVTIPTEIRKTVRIETLASVILTKIMTVVKSLTIRVEA